MVFTEKLKKEAKSAGVEPQSLIMADLLSIGYSESDAYNIAYPEREVWNIEKNMSTRDGILNDKKFKAVLEQRIQRQRSGVMIPQKLSEIELISREESLKEILMAAQKLAIGSKERGDMFIKYQEALAKMQETTGNGDTVNIYLPLKCIKCPLYADFLERKAEKIDESLNKK